MSGSPIAIGFQWRQSIQLTYTGSDQVPFPLGSTFRAEVRANAQSDTILATLTTAAGEITRDNDNQLTILIGAADTATFEPGTVSLDLVRTDVSPEEYIHVAMTVTVIQPITRPA